MATPAAGHKRKIERVECDDDEDARPRPPQPDRRAVDHTRTCADDVLLVVAEFLEDKEAARVARSSTANFQALRTFARRRPYVLRHEGFDPRFTPIQPVKSIERWTIGRWSHVRIECVRCDEVGGEERNRYSELNQHLADVNSGGQIRSIDYNCGFSIDNVSLPRGLKTLCISTSYNSPFDPSRLPLGLETLRIGVDLNEAQKKQRRKSRGFIALFGEFDHPLDVSKLPRTITHLAFGDRFRGPIDWSQLPPNLERLGFGSYFSQAITDVSLPPSIKWLKLGSYLNKHVDMAMLPEGLEVLILSTLFTHAFSTSDLPRSLTTLVLSDHFNCELDWGGLPPTLQTLILGYFFDGRMDVSKLPRTITRLEHLAHPDRFRNFRCEHGCESYCMHASNTVTQRDDHF